MQIRWTDRAEAGRALGQELLRSNLVSGPAVVQALTRGGVPVGVEVAHALKCPWEPLIVRKVGAPHQPELAVGAVADAAPPVVEFDSQTMTLCGVDRAWVQTRAQVELQEINRRRRLYQGHLRSSPLRTLVGQTAVLVDDGLATGTTMRAALRAVRARQAARVVVAIPIAPSSVLADLKPWVDGLVCLQSPDDFQAVGSYYQHFPQVEDEAVCAALDKSLEPAL